MRTETRPREVHRPPFGGKRVGIGLVLATATIAVLWFMVPTPVDAPPLVDSPASLVSAEPSPYHSASIAFVRRDEGSLEKWVKHLYLMTSDGLGQRRITREVQGWDAAWSPAGDRLAFTCPMEGNLEICVMSADGSGLARLTLNPATDENPAWSPDGQRILFDSNRKGPFQIYAMNADGSGQVALTHTATNELQPAWSPDGRHIAFASDRVVQDPVLLTREIFIMNPDGSGQMNLTRSAGACISESPAWSPDSAQIAFSSNCKAPWFQIYTMIADGSALKRLTASQAQDRHPAWSPHGTQIVFDSTRDLAGSEMRMLRDQPQIYIMYADGSDVMRLTADVPEFSSHPAWKWELDEIVRTR